MKLTNLRHEPRKVKRVPIHNNPPNIPHNLHKTSGDHTPRKEPLAPSDSEVGVQDSGEGIQDYEDDVGRKGGPVAVDGGFDGAEVEGAV